MIWFNSDRARQQLITHGKVITCRIRRKQFGSTTAYFTNDKGERAIIGKVVVKMVKETVDSYMSGVVYEDHTKGFSEYLELSGFDTVRQWEDEVLGLNSKGKIPSYLIFLEVTLKELA